ncbi:MAG: hypothetical protein LCH47_11135 [Proteobacteria bacterium]|nr:hypothetical protein [Pseudomonadota bacterium]
MFFAAAGSRLLIGGSRPEWMARIAAADDFAGEAWTEVAGVQSLGRVSGEWQTVSDTLPRASDPDAPVFENHVKAVRPTLAMQIVVAVAEDDAGQLGLLAAESADTAFAFRLVLPSGAERLFIALVISAEQAIEEAGSVLCWSFGLLLQSNLVRV